ncbi:MAG TPA: YitT family protein [Anaerolineae bacterium]|nr:YitT family protein [Anaerolineae bacterium]
MTGIERKGTGRRRLARFTSGRWKAAAQFAADYALLTTGALLLAANVNLFLVPNRVVSTGVTGLGMLAFFLWRWPIGLVTLALNVPILAAGIRWGGGWRLAVRSVYATAVMTIAIDLLALVLPPIQGDPLIFTLFGGLLDGVGIGLVLRGQGTTGGTDIIAQILNRLRGTAFGTTFIVVNSAILLAAAGVVGLIPVLYALIVNFVSGRVVDTVQEGSGYARAFFILSRESTAIRQAILDELERGVTVLDVRGGYTEARHDALYVVVSRAQVTRLKRLISDRDPHAFVVVSEAHEVLGEGFRPIVRPEAPGQRAAQKREE